MNIKRLEKLVSKTTNGFLNLTRKSTCEECNIKEYSPEYYMVVNHLNHGEYIPEQYPLFPIQEGKELQIINNLRSKSGGMTMILKSETSKSWESMIVLPQAYHTLLQLELITLADGRCGCESTEFRYQIMNPAVLSDIGFDIPKGEKCICVVENAYTMKNQISGLPSQLGWWSTDYSGYGSLIKNPFEVKITHEWVKENCREIGYLAHDYSEASTDGGTASLFIRKFMEELILPFMSKYTYTIGEGAYAGRPLGMKRGIEEIKEFSPTQISHLIPLMGLGTLIIQIA